ncbi:MAG: glycosyltransferase family 2 protein [Actinomycetes bacterium]
MSVPPPGAAPTAPPAPPEGWPGVSVVIPVLDEERDLADAVTRVLDQEYPGELEVILALGPSSDRTDEIATELVARDRRVRTVPNPSGRTPAGLNAAIATARHSIVARVDGHGMLAPGYLVTAVRLLEQTGADNVGGIMAAEGVTSFERAVATAMTSSLGVGGARFHIGGEAGPADTVYLGVFRRDTLARLGGYDETFERAQDWELNLRIRRSGGLVWFSPELHVSYRPRPHLRGLARQYFEYGRWRREVMREHPETVTVRYLAPPSALAAVLAGAVLVLLGRPRRAPLVGLAAPGGYVAGVLLGSGWIGRRLEPPARGWLPVVLVTMHLSWAVGFWTSPRGLRAGAEADPGGGQP